MCARMAPSVKTWLWTERGVESVMIWLEAVRGRFICVAIPSSVRNQLQTTDGQFSFVTVTYVINLDLTIDCR